MRITNRIISPLPKKPVKEVKATETIEEKIEVKAEENKEEVVIKEEEKTSITPKKTKKKSSLLEEILEEQEALED